MGAGEGNLQDFTVHGNPQSFSIQLFELLERLGFPVFQGLERSNLANVGGLPGLARIFLAPAWWSRDKDFGMVSGRQDPNVNTRFLENNRPREREKRLVDPLTSGGLVEGIDKSFEAGNVTS